MRYFHTTQCKRLLTILLLGLDILLPPLLQIAAYWLALLRAGLVAVAMALHFAGKNQGRGSHCVLVVHAAEKVCGLLDLFVHELCASEEEVQVEVEIRSDPWLTRATTRTPKDR
jgi:hypothetical protein